MSLGLFFLFVILVIQKLSVSQEGAPVMCHLRNHLLGTAGTFPQRIACEYATKELAQRCYTITPLPLIQHRPKGNNYNSNRHLMQHLDCTHVVVLLSPTVERVI